MFPQSRFADSSSILQNHRRATTARLTGKASTLTITTNRNLISKKNIYFNCNLRITVRILYNSAQISISFTISFSALLSGTGDCKAPAVVDGGKGRPRISTC